MQKCFLEQLGAQFKQMKNRKYQQRNTKYNKQPNGNFRAECIITETESLLAGPSNRVECEWGYRRISKLEDNKTVEINLNIRDKTDLKTMDNFRDL